jgi:hypothetical protein
MTAARLIPPGSLFVADDNDQKPDESSLSKRLGDLTFYLVGVGTIALVATSIRVWAGMDVIQTQIQTLVKSDANQDIRIEQVRTEMNNMRVQLGVMRETIRILGGGKH